MTLETTDTVTPSSPSARGLDGYAKTDMLVGWTDSGNFKPSCVGMGGRARSSLLQNLRRETGDHIGAQQPHDRTKQEYEQEQQRDAMEC